MKKLRIYEDALRLVRLCRPHWEALEKGGHPDLARQMKRCVPSVPLNITEGAWRYDGNARQRFKTAIGSARETIGCLDVGGAMGVLAVGEVAEAVDCADKVIATLWKMLRRSRA